MIPPSPARPRIAELTVRGVVLGGLVTLVFTAANVYLGLKVGLTFATSIPAAVISMAVLRYVADSTILENNIVQTVASAAGTLAAIIFVLPGLVMIGWWRGFPFWQTAGITAAGGVLGVLFSVPLRRALVTNAVGGADLPYPEGRAAAEVLRVGSESREGAAEAATGLKLIGLNALVSAGYAILTQLRVAAAEATGFFRLGGGVSTVSAGLSFALLGVGHLVGLSVGMAMLAGVTLGFWIALPILTAADPAAAGGSLGEWAGTVFARDVRFLGAGVIGVAAVWTLARIAGPVLGGVRASLAASHESRGAAAAVEERDLPFPLVVGGAAAMLVPIGWLLWDQVSAGPLSGSAVLLVAGGLAFVAVVGLAVAAVCGYMAGLIGASNSPVSGIGILAVLAAALMLAGLFGRGAAPDATAALTAYALIVTALVFGVATISNDNLQDLKTGQLVGATPWKQQVALLIGVGFGSLVVPPVLELLNRTLGFQGVAGAGPNALAAPQAALISAIARGVLGGDLNWAMIGWGAAIGAGAVALDEALGRAGRLRLPPLGVGLGIYLPMSVTLPVIAGAVIGHRYDRWADRRRDPERARRAGILAATGLIVGESLWGVAFAGLVWGTDSDAPLAITDGRFAVAAGLLLFGGLTGLLYARTMAAGR